MFFFLLSLSLSQPCTIILKQSCGLTWDQYSCLAPVNGYQHQHFRCGACQTRYIYAFFHRVAAFRRIDSDWHSLENVCILHGQHFSSAVNAYVCERVSECVFMSTIHGPVHFIAIFGSASTQNTTNTSEHRFQFGANLFDKLEISENSIFFFYLVVWIHGRWTWCRRNCCRHRLNVRFVRNSVIICANDAEKRIARNTVKWVIGVNIGAFVCQFRKYFIEVTNNFRHFEQI